MTFASDACLNLGSSMGGVVCFRQWHWMSNTETLSQFGEFREHVIWPWLSCAGASWISHPQLEQIRANLAKREQTAGSMPYAFQLAWELPQATKRSE